MVSFGVAFLYGFPLDIYSLQHCYPSDWPFFFVLFILVTRLSDGLHSLEVFLFVFERTSGDTFGPNE